MRGIFWNNNGFKYPKKHSFISDLTREQQLCFIVLYETGRKNFNDAVLRNLWGGGGIFCGTVKSLGGDLKASC
jgi:hypothetical protein